MKPAHPSTPDITWLREARWGMMFHYIDKPASSNRPSDTTSEEWNRRVESFDVERFAKQVKECEAGYVIFTLGQNTGHFCSPNAVYDEIAGVRPSKLSRRDLILEVAEALAPEVALIAYLPSHAPSNDSPAVRNFRLVPPWSGAKWGLPEAPAEWPRADERLSEFQGKWQAVVAEWGRRWGSRVAGWWIDGCYHAGQMYAGAEGPNFSTFAAALRAGYAQRLLAFNSGTSCPFERLAEEQDYTAGEVSTRLPAGNKWEPIEESTDGMLTHVLSYLGAWWGEGAPRFDGAFVESYTRYLNSCGAVMTWDVPIRADGDIPLEFREAMLPLRSSAPFV